MARTRDTPPMIIKRNAIDLSGHPGYLYDACQDRVLETLQINFDKPPDQLYQKTQCILEKGGNIQNRNFLELIDIDEQLRLSLLLNLTSKHGIVAAMDHPHIIDEYTRILHYLYIHREERFPDEVEKVLQWLHTTMPETDATHLITAISWGVDIVVILQLPSEDNIVAMIDETLEKYRAFLNGDRDDFKITRDDIDSYGEILDTKVYSNIRDLTEMTSIHDIFHSIARFKIDDTQHQRLTYTLHPVLHSRFVPLVSTNGIQLEQYLYELLTSIKTIGLYLNEDLLKLLYGHFKERLSNAYQQWSYVKNEYNKIIERFSELIIKFRHGNIQISTLEMELRSEEQMILKKAICDIIQNITDLNAKGHLISDLSDQNIQYCNVMEEHLDENDNEETLKRKLMGDRNIDRILCSNDLLNKNNPILLKRLRNSLVEELDRDPKLRLLYADFTYCPFQLRNMMILSSTENDKKTVKSKYKKRLSSIEIHSSASSLTMERLPSPLSLSKPATNEIINILLIGETGVGKSTFINAFVNYLTFKTLNKAQSSKPVITIPVSFLITVGDNFEERLVQFDNVDRSNNEDFDHPGKSVTQHCQSYVYHFRNSDKRKLRFIDTPGFGDTRGLNQDDLNMEYILEYIKKYSYLNAICFFLKPNESRLNIFFRSCLTQLFNLLGPDVGDNIVFCFTNSRSTFYTPGNTAPLLKSLLSSLSVRNIPFNKKNTFCFDSESFRYLVALQNEITFNDSQKQEYEMSWINSVTETKRLIHYIRKTLTLYPIPDESEYIRTIQVDIVQMIHPMLEAIRNILQNIIMNKMISLKGSTELHSNRILSDEMQKNSHNHQHLPHQPISVDFLQDYEILNGPLDQKQNEMIDQLTLLSHVSAEFGYFLVHTARYSQRDPFLTGLLRLVTEEKINCEKQNHNYMNLQLVEGLTNLVKTYEQHRQVIKSSPKRSTLADIFEWVTYMHDYPLISGYVIRSPRGNVGSTNETTSI